MSIFKLLPIFLAAFIAMPAMAEEPAIPAFDNEEMPEEQTEAPFIPSFEKPDRQGPATATDKIVDRFMQLNTNPESSAGVDYAEYFFMVEQRAKDRFAAMDSNQDGEVTAEEYRDFWRAQKAQYYRLKR